ncbi:hypothetical protein EDC96DRAFT_515705 [Choanephora cucurbitarum]|nr:hypothetical protein EDC96DRAFT_515705 [Choanephora cucurbitarum]
MGKLIQPFTLRSSDNGLFSAQLHLPDSPARPLTHLWLREVNKKDRRRPMGAYDGWISLIEPDGVSVISDIDDTIKQTHVTSGARTVLNNTFFYPSQPVPGMAAHYRQWYQLGISFHYVSNSPIQLARMLLNFLQNHQFPPGSLHLRDLRHILSELIEPPGQSKIETIRAILKDFPHRQFVLIGDSGESDLDVYTQIATEFPQQILKIYIRHVPTEPTEVQTDSNKIMVESDEVNFDPTDIQQTKEETQESIKPTTQLASLVIPEPVTAILPQKSSSEAELRERVAEAQKLLSDVDIVLFEHVNELEIKK